MLTQARDAPNLSRTRCRPRGPRWQRLVPVLSSQFHIGHPFSSPFAGIARKTVPKGKGHTAAQGPRNQTPRGLPLASGAPGVDRRGSLCRAAPLSFVLSVSSQPGQSWHPLVRALSPALSSSRVTHAGSWGGGGRGEHQAGCVNSKAITSMSLRSLHTGDKWLIEVDAAPAVWMVGRLHYPGKRYPIAGGWAASRPPSRTRGIQFPRLWARTQRVHLRCGVARWPPSPLGVHARQGRLVAQNLLSVCGGQEGVESPAHREPCTRFGY